MRRGVAGAVRDDDRARRRLRGRGDERRAEPRRHVWSRRTSVISAEPRRASRTCAWSPGSARGSRSGTLGAIAGQTYGRACLLDHVAQLRELLADLLDEDVGIELDEQTLSNAPLRGDRTRAWRHGINAGPGEGGQSRQAMRTCVRDLRRGMLRVG